MGTADTTSLRTGPVGEPVRTLDRLLQVSEIVDGVWADAIRPGDWLVVCTKNSVYSLAAQGDGRYRVAGGWFAAADAEGSDVRIVGCTWGGAAIHTKLAAAVGMFLEFDNGVRTTRIREVWLIRGGSQTAH